MQRLRPVLDGECFHRSSWCTRPGVLQRLAAPLCRTTWVRLRFGGRDIAGNRESVWSTTFRREKSASSNSAWVASDVVPAQAEGRIHQRHVGEGLGKVADQAPVAGVVLLGEEAEVVAQRQQAREELFGLVGATDHVQAVDQPEGARQECPFAPGQTVDLAVVGRAVPQDEAVVDQPLLHSFDGADRPGGRSPGGIPTNGIIRTLASSRSHS